MGLGVQPPWCPRALLRSPPKLLLVSRCGTDTHHLGETQRRCPSPSPWDTGKEEQTVPSRAPGPVGAGRGGAPESHAAAAQMPTCLVTKVTGGDGSGFSGAGPRAPTSLHKGFRRGRGLQVPLALHDSISPSPSNPKALTAMMNLILAGAGQHTSCPSLVRLVLPYRVLPVPRKEPDRDLRHTPNPPFFLLCKVQEVRQPEGSQICAHGTSTWAWWVPPEPPLANRWPLTYAEVTAALGAASRTRLRVQWVGSTQAAATVQALLSPRLPAHHT